MVGVESDDIELVHEMSCQERSTCLPEFEKLALIIMEERHLVYPVNHMDAENLYLELLQALEDFENS